MPQAINALLAALASKLGGLSPLAKAVVPAALGVAEIAVNLAFTGSLNSSELAASVSALVSSVIVYLVPNLPKGK